MSTPTAKRRRVDAANAALRKPFQSPVIRRPAPAPAPAGGTSGLEETNSQTSDTATSKRSFDEKVYSHSSPSVPRELGALRQTQPASPLLKLSKTPPGSAARPGTKRKPFGTYAKAAGVVSNDDADIGGDNENPFMALVKSHRATGQDTMIKDVEKQLETIHQARKIEDASERRNLGQPVDQELRDLVTKWKGASRLAAEELFEMVKERVDSSGGPKAWKAMQQRQMEFYRGLDQDSPTDSKTAGNGGSEEKEDYPQGEVETVLEKEQRLQGDGRAQGDSDGDEDEPNFNLAMMLRSLNIDLSMLGYDETEEKWVD